ncbi:hypothetical protein RhiirA5_414972 [Rhizophagus irregularis]|uniref:Uncharacterized protein n=1 Tax=Rhizophagus irregularis TaxID=588596 RepID=A0A2N0PT46_9GLOM|nr:hypothetical protein RhiirA5_414972 [Rhizophagus irregularis]
MKIWNYQDFEYTKGLFKAIAKNHPNFECLYINIQFEDLNGIKEILLGCTILNRLHLYINDEIEEEEDNCDEILNILADCGETGPQLNFMPILIVVITLLQNILRF